MESTEKIGTQIIDLNDLEEPKENWLIRLFRRLFRNEKKEN